MESGIGQYKKMWLCLLILLLFSGNCLLAQKADATPEVIALCNTDSSAVKGTGFTPNGDGTDDVFSFKPVNMASMKVLIFDKDRNILYKSDKLDAKWDGYDLKKQKAKAGIYYFIQTGLGLDGKTYEQKGCIKLTR
ncbi:MAG: hypothetical protein JWP12_2318 [Bacteroidetes bacterium]|nr:hypothetical protein [Bacteroidota bacterium]